MAAADLLDIQALNQYTMGDRALQREVSGIFFGEAPAYLARLDAALNGGSQEDWRAAAHGLKGAALGLGMTAVGAAAKDMERGTPDQDARTHVEALLQETRAAMDAVLES